jgi:cytochrome P450
MPVQTDTIAAQRGPTLSLYHLYEPGILADPYPLYHRLRSEDPVHWDPFLHAWVVTRYRDVAWVLLNLSANCAPSTKKLAEMDLSSMDPIAATMIQQMLFMDPPRHTRLRALCSVAFTPHRVEALRSHIQEIVDRLLEPLLPKGRTDLMADFANRLPAIVTAEILGVPTSDHEQLKSWSADFAEILGNFQHNPDGLNRMLRSLEEMTDYFRAAIHDEKVRNSGGLMSALMTAELDGERLSEDAVIANTILLMVGGQETTPNLIGNGMLSLLRNPDQLADLRANPALMPSAIEEMLRYEAPSQHTTRLAFEDMRLGGNLIRKQQSVIAVMGAGNRDPERFPDPDRLDLKRSDNRHLAFGAGGHFCFGAALARIEGQIAFTTILRRMSEIGLETEDLVWRRNLGLRGLAALPLVFTANASV